MSNENTIEHSKANLLTTIKTDIVENYTDLLNGNKNVEAFRYLLYGNVYSGKYKGRLCGFMGYADEYQSALPFLKLINRLVITHEEFFNTFVAAWKKDQEKNSSEHATMLLQEFNRLNTKSYQDLNAAIQDRVSALAKKIVGEGDDTKATEDFITQVVTYTAKEEGETKTYDYFDLKTETDSLLQKSGLNKITHQQKLEIFKLRETCQQNEKNLHKSLEHFQKDINHYLLSLNDSKAESDAIIKDADSGVFDPKYKPGKITAEQRAKNEETHTIEQENEQIASLVSVNVGIGEGTVAGVAMFAFLAATGVLLPVAIAFGVATGLAGVCCNKYLVHDDTREILDQLRIHDMMGTMNPVAKDIAIALGTSSLATGFIYAALSAMQLYHGLLTPVLSLMPLNHATVTVLASVFACFPVGFTAVGLASIFFFVIIDFIKNKRWQGIKEWFFKTYLDLGWGEKWNNKEFSGIAKLVVRCFLKTLQLLIGVAINLLITFVSFGLFHAQGVKLLSLIANGQLSSRLSTALTSINAVIATVFGLTKINDFLEQLSFKSVSLHFMTVPYYLLKLSFLILDKGFDLLAKVLSFNLVVKLVKNIVTSLVTGISYVVQFAMTLTSSLVTTLFSTFKYVIMAMGLFPQLIAAALEVVRAVVSLTLRFCEWGCEKILGGKFDAAHDTIDTFMNKIISTLQACFKQLVSAGKFMEPTQLNQKINQTVKGVNNKIADLRQALNSCFNKVFALLLKGTGFCHTFLTQKNVTLSIFAALFSRLNFADKKAKEKSSQQSQKNPIQAAVGAFSGKANLFAQTCTVANGVGQSCLFASSATGAALALTTGTAEFIYSSAPNAIAVDESMKKTFGFAAAEKEEEATDFTLVTPYAASIG